MHTKYEYVHGGGEGGVLIIKDSLLLILSTTSLEHVKGIEKTVLLVLIFVEFKKVNGIKTIICSKLNATCCRIALSIEYDMFHDIATLKN